MYLLGRGDAGKMGRTVLFKAPSSYRWSSFKRSYQKFVHKRERGAAKLCNSPKSFSSKSAEIALKVYHSPNIENGIYQELFVCSVFWSRVQQKLATLTICLTLDLQLVAVCKHKSAETNPVSFETWWSFSYFYLYPGIRVPGYVSMHSNICERQRNSEHNELNNKKYKRCLFKTNALHLLPLVVCIMYGSDAGPVPALLTEATLIAYKRSLSKPSSSPVLAEPGRRSHSACKCYTGKCTLMRKCSL